ncbi:dentin sialophosphoprotein isoform X2 [Nilaparvata lugens]|nr:dentin sialophosphoprotein isoform X2 [Nilaparvata lugens]
MKMNLDIMYKDKNPNWVRSGQIPAAEMWAEHFNRTVKRRNPIYTKYFDKHLALCRVRYGFLNADQIFGIALEKLNIPACGFKIKKTFMKQLKTNRPRRLSKNNNQYSRSANVIATSVRLFEDCDESSIIENDFSRHPEIIEAPSSPAFQDNVYDDLTELFEATEIQPYKPLCRKTRPSHVSTKTNEQQKNINSPKDKRLLNQFEKFKDMSKMSCENSQPKNMEEKNAVSSSAKVDLSTIMNKSILKNSSHQINVSTLDKSVQFHTNLEEIFEFSVPEKDNDSSTIEYNSPNDESLNILDDESNDDEGENEELKEGISQNTYIFSDEKTTVCKDNIFESSLQNKEIYMEKDVSITDQHNLPNSWHESIGRDKNEIEAFSELHNVCSPDRTIEPIERSYLSSSRIETHLSDEELSCIEVHKRTQERPICQPNEIISEENAQDVRTPIAIDNFEKRQSNSKNEEKESLRFDSVKIPFFPRNKINNSDVLETEIFFFESTEIQLHDVTEIIDNENEFLTQDSSNQGLEEFVGEDVETDRRSNRSDPSNNESSNRSINSNLEKIEMLSGSGKKMVESVEVNKYTTYLQSKNIPFTKNISSEEKARQCNVRVLFDNESLKSNQNESKYSSPSEIEKKLCSGGEMVENDSCGESNISHFQSINIPFGKGNKPQKKLNTKQLSHMQSANIKIRKIFDREVNSLEKPPSQISPTPMQAPIQHANRFEHLSEGHISSQLFEMENELQDYHSNSSSESSGARKGDKNSNSSLILSDCFRNMSKYSNESDKNGIDARSSEQVSTNYDLTLDDMWDCVDDGRESTLIDKSMSFNIPSVDDDYQMLESDDSLAEVCKAMKKPMLSTFGADFGSTKNQRKFDEESLASSLHLSFSPKRRKQNTDGALGKSVLCATSGENAPSQTTAESNALKRCLDWLEQSDKQNPTSWMATTAAASDGLMQLTIPDQHAMDDGGQQHLNIPDIEFSSSEY